jgi:hypothetical protein
MNYYLADIRTFLLTQSLTGFTITIDQYQPDLPNQICLISEGGEIGKDQYDNQFNFRILVSSKETTKKASREISETIMNVLNSQRGTLTNSGSPVKFLKIACTQPPQYLDTTNNNLPLFVTFYEAKLIQTNLNTSFI